MHPNRAFGWQDEAAMLAFIRAVSFATICVDGPRVAHAPVLPDGDACLRFHLSRANAVVPSLDGARAVLSVLGPDAYVSPDWYGSADQVPTWNYIAIEAEGCLRRLDEDALVRLLDDLSAEHESRLAPKPSWTRAKMTPGRFAPMLKAIVGYEMRIEALRGTRKLGQTKNDSERQGAAAGLAPFHPVMAGLMRA